MSPAGLYDLSPRAVIEIERIIAYRRREAGLQNAERLRADLTAAFQLIGANPHIGHQRPDLTPRPYRFWLKHGYWIIHRVGPGSSPVLIVAVIDARRDVGRLLG